MSTFQKAFIVSLGLGLAFSASSALASITVPSPHRKIDSKGIGNCVFSTKTLDFKKDGSFSLTNKFTAPQEVHVRCYFPQTLKEYIPIGKIYNSIKERDKYYASLSVKSSDGGYFVISNPTYTYDDEVKDRDQQRYDIDGTADGTDFGMTERDAERFGATEKRSNGYSAVNMGNYVKAMAESAGKYPYTANFCVDTYVSMSDINKTVEKVNKSTNQREWVQEPVIKDHLMARGCFDYTINSASDVSWSSKDKSSSTSESSSTTTPENAAVDAAKDLIKGFGF